MENNNIFASIKTGINEAIKYENGTLNKKVRTNKIFINKILYSFIFLHKF